MTGCRDARGLLVLVLAWAMTACASKPAAPEATVTSPPLPTSVTESPVVSPEPTLGEPATLTPGLPTPAADPLPHLSAGREIVIQEIRMIDASTGWAVAQAEDDFNRIVRTSDGGLTWKDVTPPEAPPDPENPRSVLGYFADGARAWVVFGSAVDLERGPIAATAWRSSDAGEIWIPSTLIEVPSGSGWFEPLALGVLDDGFGWLMAAIDAGMMHQYIAIYTTQDAGGTWTRVLDPYSDAPVQSCPKTGLAYADASIGWMTRDCGGLIDRVTVITTADGGVAWTEVPLPPPPGLPEGFTYPYLCTPHSIHLQSAREGSLAVSCRQYLETPTAAGETTVSGPSALYRTSDAGASWSSLDYPGGDVQWLDDLHGWAFGRDLYRTRDGGATWALIHSVNWDGQFSFVDDDHGWAVARNEEEIALVRTQNGGARWSILRPVIAP